jgi:hypothetical protein
MSEALSKVIERASTDAAFRAQLQSNPEAALADYALTAEEKAALLSGDRGKLGALGVDPRVTKLYDTTNVVDDGSAFPTQPFSS